MRVVVLGGTGYIGRAIVRDLHAHGHEVVIVHRGETEPRDLPNAEHVHAARDALPGLGNADGFVDVRAMTRTEAEHGARAIPRGARAVVLSSMDVYRAYTALLEESEAIEPVPFFETSPVRTKRYPFRGMPEGRGDDYEKLDVEEIYLGRDATVLRLPMVYGEHDRQRREEFVLRRVRAGRGRLPFGSGSWLWSRGYVGDVGAAVRLALEHERASGHVFNVCEARTMTVRQWAEAILDAADANVEIVRVPDEVLPRDLEITKAIPQHFVCDAAKIRTMLGFEETDPREALRRSVQWHLANPPESDPDFTADDAALALAKR